MNDLFHIIEDAYAILLHKGVYHQRKVYWRGDRLFAAWGSGFIRIGGHRTTSCPGVSCEGLDIPPLTGVRIDKTTCGAPQFVRLEQVKEAA